MALSKTVATNGSSREKLYPELGLETLHKRSWIYRLCLFYKKEKNKSPSFLFRLITTTNRMYISLDTQTN